MHHVTRWDIALATETCIQVAVHGATGTGASLRAVWAPTYPEMVSGDWEFFGDGVELPARGFFRTEWQPIPIEALAIGEVCLSFVLIVTTPVDTLTMGAPALFVR